MDSTLDVREKLKELRAENRISNLRNMDLQIEVTNAVQMTRRFKQQKEEKIQETEALILKTDQELKEEGEERTKTRLERRKEIMLQIQATIEENDKLEEEIKDLNNKLSNFKTLHKIYSARNPSLQCSVVPIPT